VNDASGSRRGLPGEGELSAAERSKRPLSLRMVLIEATWAIGAVNVFSTFIATAFIDRLGRRPLLIAGLIGMGLSLAAVGLAFEQSGGVRGAQGATGVVTLVALVIFVVSFAFSSAL
jgi:MFS family permease